MITIAEKFPLKCVTKHDVESFDELCYVVYHVKHLPIERFPPKTNSISQHILRVYFQWYKWLKSPFLVDILLFQLHYSYYIDKVDDIVPIVPTNPSWSVPIFCKCRVLGIACCQYCKWHIGSECKNHVK